MRPGYAARRFSASQQASRNVTSPAVQRTSRRRYPLGQCRVRSRPIVLKKSGFVADHKWRGSGRARSGKTRSTANTSEEPVETCGRGDEPATMRWAPSPHGFLLFGHSIENRLFKTIDPLLPLTEPTVRHGARAAEAEPQDLYRADDGRSAIGRLGRHQRPRGNLNAFASGGSLRINRAKLPPTP